MPGRAGPGTCGVATRLPLCGNDGRMSSLVFTRVRPGFLAALMLAWFWGQVISVSPELGITADETIHLTSGYGYWRHGDYRLQPENGNLPQRLAALPLLALEPAFPPANDPDLERADVWGVSHRFFYHLGNQPGLMIFLGRLMVALVGVATGGLVYLWAKSLWGAAGGLVATAFFCTSPNLLAHAGLATSDLLASCGFLGATLTGWRLLHRVTVGRILLFGVAAGGLALAKFSAPLFVIIFAVLVILRLLRRAPLPVAVGRWRGWCRGWRRWPALAAATGLAGLLALTLLWSAYGFRYAAAPGPAPVVFLLKWEYLLGQIPYSMQLPVPAGLEPIRPVAVQADFPRAVVQWARDHRVLPEAYLWGFAYVYTYSQWRPAFFLGEYDTTGWRSFFPVSILLKTPLATLVLALLAGMLLVRLHRQVRPAARWWYRLAPLLALILVYGAFAVFSRLNLGIRHLLPAEVACCVAGGVLVLAFRAWPRIGPALVALLFLAVNLATWSVRPGYLAYFNALAGGPDQGHAYLVDSSLDWGQGLPRLGTWFAQHRGTERVYLSYFGSDSPWYHDLRAIRIGDSFFNREPLNTPLQLYPGLYAISATQLQGVYTMAPGPWTAAHETAYQARLPLVFSENRMKLGGEFWLEWDQLRFARLRHFLLRQKPLARPDPSILIYRLGAGELSAALGYPVR